MKSKTPTAKHKFEGHNGMISSFVFLHDIVHIASGSWDGTMRKWDCDTGCLVGIPERRKIGRITTLALSPDGKTIACGRANGSVERWNTDGKMAQSIWAGHGNWVLSLSWSPRGDHIASGFDDGAILIREAESGKVAALGDRIASGGKGTICIWDSNTGKPLVSPIKSQGFLGVESVVWSLDGGKLYSASDKFACVFHSFSGILLHRFKHNNLLTSVALSPKHNVLACVGYGGIAQLWDTQSHKPLGKLFHHEDRKHIHYVSFSRDGKYLAYGGIDKKITLWTVQDITPQLTVCAPMRKIHITQEETQPEPPSSSFLRVNVDVTNPCMRPGSDDIMEEGRDDPYDNFFAYTELQGRPKPRSFELSNSPAPASPNCKPTERTPGGTAVGGDEDAECHNDVDRPHNNDKGKQRECLPARAETPSPSPPTTLDNDNNRKLWKLTKHKEGKGESEDMGDETHEDADPIHRHRDVRQVLFTKVESDSHLPLAPEAMLKDLIGSITKVGSYPVARGGFGAIWKCTHETDLGPVLVAVKSLITYASDEVGGAMDKKTKRIWRELKICLRLKHPNILPVHGYTSGFGPFIAIVSPWADNGNLTSYLEREDTGLTIVKRFQILRDVAAGLRYLHTSNVIHGDLTGANVLIHGDGTACLADFGLSLLYSDIVSVSQASWTSTFHGNSRWLAPELLGMSEDNLPVRPRKYSDIYSFGSMMLQVLTSKVPYYYLREAAVTVSISTGIKPSRSLYPAFSDKYWDFIEECWSAAAQERPSAERVVEVISDEFHSLSSSM